MCVECGRSVGEIEEGKKREMKETPTSNNNNKGKMSDRLEGYAIIS